jgi:DNA polymerase I-like protein with 3'-5' exonuclease and polymerase domains
MGAKYQLKVFDTLPFICEAKQCPKHLDTYNRALLRNAFEPLHANFSATGCAQFRTFIYGLSDRACSEDEWAKAPTIGAVLPCPDPTGAQGVANTFGVSRDLILDAIHSQAPGPVKVAIFYLTRGYSFEKVFRGELSPKSPNEAAISNCFHYLCDDIDKVKPQKLLLCGFESGNIFFPGPFELANYRRKTGLTAKIRDREYPVQITFPPYFAATQPAFIKTIREDCAKLFKDTPTLPSGKTRLLINFEEAMEYLDWLAGYEGFVCVDTETENLNRVAQNKLGTLQFATSADEGVVIPYQHYECPFSPDELFMLKARFRHLFIKPSKIFGWIAHNAKFENTMFKQHFQTFMESAPIYDTQAMAFLVDETRSERKADIPKGGGIYSLKQLARDELNFEGYDKGVLAHRQAGTLMDLPLKVLAPYGAMDTWVTYALFEKLQERALEQGYLKQLMKLTKNFYGPITKLVAHIEISGFKTDLKALRNLKSKKGPFEAKIESIEKTLKGMPAFVEANGILAKSMSGNNPQPKGVLGNTPWVLDLSKTAHQRKIFFDVMHLDPVSYSEKTYQPSIDDEFFTEYREENPEVELFAQYEETKNMRDTFINKILERVDPEFGKSADCKVDQRIRPDIFYSNLVTGRLVMKNPNMGQIPKAEEDAEEGSEDLLVRKAVKDIFTVDHGCALIQYDYKVNEVRWAAILSKDPVLAALFNEAADMLKKAIQAGDEELIKKALYYEDIHRATASAMFKIPREAVSKKQRQVAKSITFGILFQQSAKALALAVNITLEEAEQHIATFFASMKNVDVWIKSIKEFASVNGYVEAPHGRRRRLWAFELPNTWRGRRSQTARNERQAVNSPIQGVASDGGMLGGACSLLDYIEENKKPWIIQNVVHDSCILQTPMDQAYDALMIAEEIFVDRAMRRMEKLGIEFNLPLGVDAEAGIKWGSMTKWNGTKAHAIKLQEEIQQYYKAI